MIYITFLAWLRRRARADIDAELKRSWEEGEGEGPRARFADILINRPVHRRRNTVNWMLLSRLDRFDGDKNFYCVIFFFFKFRIPTTGI